MPRVTKLLAIVLLFALPGCASSGFFSTNYEGKDTGYLVTSLGAQTGTVYNGYSLFFRKKDRSYSGRVFWGQANMFEDRKPDFEDGSKAGIVDVTRLPPGDYEVFNFQIFYNAGTAQSWFSSKQDFSIPFTVRRGAGTYIGEFVAVGIKGQNFFGMAVPAGGYFVVSNRTSRDIPIAKRKEPAMRDVASAVSNLRTVGNPLLKTGAR
jgi:hypothetical protein